MKNIIPAALLLSTFAAPAFADVVLTGDARMGVVFDGKNTQFSERARLRFTMSGKTDTGLEFGATFRADEAGNSADGGAFGNSKGKQGSVYIKGGFGQLTMGKVASAAETAFGNMSGVGYTGLGDMADIPYINGDGAPDAEQGPGALYSFKKDGFELHLGLTDGSLPAGLNANGDYIEGGTSASVAGDEADAAWSLAAAYSGDTYKIGIGYLDNGSTDVNPYGGSELVLSGAVAIKKFAAKAFYASFDDYQNFDTSAGISVDYTLGAATWTAFTRQDDHTDKKVESYGIGATYDLGGGAIVKTGVVNSDAVAGGDTVADLGIQFAF